MKIIEVLSRIKGLTRITGTDLLSIVGTKHISDDRELTYGFIYTFTYFSHLPNKKLSSEIMYMNNNFPNKIDYKLMVDRISGEYTLTVELYATEKQLINESRHHTLYTLMDQLPRNVLSLCLYEYFRVASINPMVFVI